MGLVCILMYSQNNIGAPQSKSRFFYFLLVQTQSVLLKTRQNVSCLLFVQMHIHLDGILNLNLVTSTVRLFVFKLYQKF